MKALLEFFDIHFCCLTFQMLFHLFDHLSIIVIFSILCNLVGFDLLVKRQANLIYLEHFIEKIVDLKNKPFLIQTST